MEECYLLNCSFWLAQLAFSGSPTKGWHCPQWPSCIKHHSRKCFMGLPTGQSGGSIFSIKVHFSQMTRTFYQADTADKPANLIKFGLELTYFTAIVFLSDGKLPEFGKSKSPELNLKTFSPRSVTRIELKSQVNSQSSKRIKWVLPIGEEQPESEWFMRKPSKWHNVFKCTGMKELTTPKPRFSHSLCQRQREIEQFTVSGKLKDLITIRSLLKELTPKSSKTKGKQ